MSMEMSSCDFLDLIGITEILSVDLHAMAKEQTIPFSKNESIRSASFLFAKKKSRPSCTSLIFTVSLWALCLRISCSRYKNVRL